jgi:hypothetical protein
MEQMDNFHTLSQLLIYIENNYEEEQQLIIEDLMSYYINEYKNCGKHNCEYTYKDNLKNDKTGELHKIARIGFEFEKKQCDRKYKKSIK